MNLRPFFGYYGSKWNLAKFYPAPRYDTIVEPFAGSAGYSLRHSARQVVLVEKDPIVAAVWGYLIAVSPEEILALPDLEPDASASDLKVPQEARWLIGFWLHKQATKPRETVSSWMKKHPTGGFWGPRARERIAKQVEAIRHWRVIEGDYSAAVHSAATWFVDPPYQKAGSKYECSSKDVDYSSLAEWCRSRPGHTIACEGPGADWLPFVPLGSIKSVRGKHRGEELVWENQTATSDPRAKPGTDEWLKEISQTLRLKLRATEGDCRDVARYYRNLREAVARRDLVWDDFCREHLGVAGAFVDSVVAGVRALQARGHKGKIGRDQALAETLAAAEANPLQDGPGAPEGSANAAHNKPDNVRINSREYGNDPVYLAARIKRDEPEIFERLKAGEIKSVRAAAIEAGIVKVKPAVDRAMAIVAKMTLPELYDFESRFDEFLQQRRRD